MDKGKYIKSFLTGAIAAAYIIPRINSKKNRERVQKGLSRLFHFVNKI